MYRFAVILFFQAVFFLYSSSSFSQCNFEVSGVQQAPSTCQSNGIIRATLSGASVISGDIDITDAKFGITSISTPYVQTPVANGGIITNVPPGSYTVRVHAYCRSSNSWVTRVSSAVQVTGSYTVPDINRIYVESANIQPSLKCSPTGSVPLHLQGGLPPYTITLSNIPATYTGPTVFTYDTEGVFTIPDLPKGSYTIDVSDHCTYTIYGLDATVGELSPSYTIAAVQNTPVCLHSGAVSIALANGTVPYTIELSIAPPTYTGASSYTVPADGTFDVEGLPVGSYTFIVSDGCYSQTLLADVLEVPLQLLAFTSRGSSSCGEEGAISFTVEGGLAPYTINLVDAPASYAGATTFSQPTDGMFSLPNLPEGSYTFEVTDACNTEQTSAAITVAKIPLVASLLATTATNTCDPGGSARIKVQGGKAPYTLRLTSTAPSGYVDPSPIVLTEAEAANYTLSGMPAGSYVFEVVDDCGDTQEIHITIASKPLVVAVAKNIRSLACVATGELTLVVSGGKPPYEVVMTAPVASSPYTSADGRTFVIGNLPSGTYTFSVTDACGVVETVTATIDDLLTNIPLDPYFEFFLPPTPSDPSCSKVRIIRNKNATGDLDFYWNKNASTYYEVAFVEDTNTDPPALWVWQPVEDVTTITLSRSYCTMRSQAGYLNAYVRVKGDLQGNCGIVTDRIDIKPVTTTLGAPYNQDCANGFDMRFRQATNEDGLFCYPYSWKLINEHGVTVKSASGVTNANEQTIVGIPYGKYYMEFSDAEGCSWQSAEFEYYWSPDPTVSIRAIPYCNDFSSAFTVTDVCPPYSWKLYDGANLLIESELDIPTTGEERVLTNLTYDETYTLTVIYSNGQAEKSFTIREQLAALRHYAIDFEPSYCLPDTAKGYIAISRMPANSSFEPGSVVRFISGETTPVHTEITVTDATIRQLYPFSIDSTELSYQHILPGIYTFEVVDACGNVYPLSVDYQRTSLKDFTYSLNETCSGLELYPQGQLYLGAVPQPTYFRISEAPSGIIVNSASVQVPNYLFLPESGRYVIQVSNTSSPTSCPYDTLTISYLRQSVSLDIDATSAYVCKEGEVGYLRVRRKGGIGPFEYELFDRGVSKGRNTTGIFHYGTLGQVYTIRVMDLGCRVSFDQNVELINLSNEKLLFANGNFCKGETIELHSLALDTNVYSWEGPAGFTSNERNPQIPNAQLENAGKYTLTVHPEGCVSPIAQSITINVHQPAPPAVASQFILCLNSPAKALEGVPDPYHHLRWYDSDGVSVLPSAPLPNTQLVHTEHYYVSQVSDLLGCESEKIPVQVSVADLPDPLHSATAQPVCPNMFPIFTILSPQLGYTYRAYTTSNGGVAVGENIATSDSLTLRTTYPVARSMIFYIETLDHNECAAPFRTAVNVEVRNSLYILTDVLPTYRRGTTYNVQLESNAKSPYVYSAATPLPNGFSLYSTGLITGKISTNERLQPDTFTVSLVDSAGCVAAKTYQLKSDPFTPQVFTPDGDGVNDHFMKGHHVVIFDRLGIIIFEGNDGWDGSYKGNPAPVDTYFYLLDYERSDGTVGQSKGYIAIVRGGR